MLPAAPLVLVVALLLRHLTMDDLLQALAFVSTAWLCVMLVKICQ